MAISDCRLPLYQAPALVPDGARPLSLGDVAAALRDLVLQNRALEARVAVLELIVRVQEEGVI